MVGKAGNEAGNVLGVQILKGFVGHSTWTLSWRPVRVDSQPPTASKASRQEISKICVFLLFCSFAELTNSTQKILCRVFEEVFCSNIIFQDSMSYLRL